MQSLSAYPSICLIVPFFDEKKKLAFLRKKQFPAYFDFFLETFSKNRHVTLKIFTNIPPRKYSLYTKSASISFHPMSLSEAFRLFQSKLNLTGLTYQDFRAYKICDFKPMFGQVFAEHLQGFDYWGYCDVDMIIGDLSQHLCAMNIGEYDLITATSQLTGYLTLYKNNAIMNALYQKSPDYSQVLNSPKNYRFDESGYDGVIAMEQVLEREQIKIKYLSKLVHNDCGSNNVDRNWQYFWQDGRLTDTLTQEEIGALHLVKSKRDGNFTINQLRKNQPFLINRQGIQFV